jgi:hypothetical protein
MDAQGIFHSMRAMCFDWRKIAASVAFAMIVIRPASGAELQKDDLELMFQCRLAVQRPDVRTPWAQDLLRSRLDARERIWAVYSANDPKYEVAIGLITNVCSRALSQGNSRVADVSDVDKAVQQVLVTFTRKGAADSITLSKQAEMSAAPTSAEAQSQAVPPSYRAEASAPRTTTNAAIEEPRRDKLPFGSSSTPVEVHVPSDGVGIPKVTGLAPPSNPGQLEPWPPPRATDYAILTNIAKRRPDLKTVGDVNDELRDQLYASKEYRLRYWGAPGGFALVIPLEPIDDEGHRADGLAKSSSADWSWASIYQEFYYGVANLVAGPVRRYRILLFVITNDISVRNQQTPMTNKDGEHWEAQGGVGVPPIVDQSTPIMSNHLAAVFVYEFEKTKNGDLRILDKSKTSVSDHLHSSNLKWFF